MHIFTYLHHIVYQRAPCNTQVAAALVEAGWGTDRRDEYMSAACGFTMIGIVKSSCGAVLKFNHSP
jgi:hypothetical protein